MATFASERLDADVISAADDSADSRDGDFDPAIFAMAEVSALKALVGRGASAVERLTVADWELVSI
jgi:hypothetical protein